MPDFRLNFGPAHWPSPVAWLLATFLLCGGCATTAPVATDPPAEVAVNRAATTSVTATKAAPTAQQVGDTTLAEGIAMYNKGDFNGAVRLLQSTPEIWTASVDTRLQAYKYVAFSYCIANRRQPCRNAFDELLKLNPGYELSAAEAGHPMWGPVFKQAKRELKGPARAHPQSPIAETTMPKRRVVQSAN